jgi:hypothetical protein
VKQQAIFDRPQMFTKARTNNLLLAMAYCGLNNLQFRMCVRSSHNKTVSVEDIFHDSGVNWEMAYQLNDTISSSISKLMTVLDRLSTSHDSATVYSKLHMVIRMFMMSYRVHFQKSGVDPRPECDIDGKSGTVTQPVVSVVLAHYNYKELENGEKDLSLMKLHKTSMPINMNIKYFRIAFAAHYLFHLHFYIGNECKLWVDNVKGMPAKERDAAFPAFSMTDTSMQAEAYMETFRSGCGVVHDIIVKHTSKLERVAKDYEKMCPKEEGDSVNNKKQ